MRDLTKEELELAPSWATHYQFGVMGNLIFISLRKMLAWNVNVPLSMTVDLEDCSYLIDKPRRIERKPFDITKHEVTNHVTVLRSGELVVDSCGWIIDKDRAIAIAKVLGVTGDDL